MGRRAFVHPTKIGRKMRFLAISAFSLMFVSLPSPSWDGNVVVDPYGVHHLQRGDKPKGWSYPVRGYILGNPIRYSALSTRALEDIPGIGPSLADKLMVLRTEKEQVTWSDIDAIPGIGKKKLSILKKTISLSD